MNIWNNIFELRVKDWIEQRSRKESLKETSLTLYISFVVDKCAKCDSHARCDNGNCVCMEGWVGDGQTCTPKDGGGREYLILLH